MGAAEILEHLQGANSAELKAVRDTAQALLDLAHLDGEDNLRIAEALAESEAQFERGEGIPTAEVWRRLGI